MRARAPSDIQPLLLSMTFGFFCVRQSADAVWARITSQYPMNIRIISTEKEMENERDGYIYDGTTKIIQLNNKNILNCTLIESSV